MKLIKTPVKGMNDCLPREERLRRKVLAAIRETYAAFGFDEVETPAVEHIENLTGKEGGENEKLIFRVMKREACTLSTRSFSSASSKGRLVR